MPRTPKAFCKRGHLRSPENLRSRIDKFGRSFSACRACLAINAKDYARRHHKPRKPGFSVGYRKPTLALKPISGIAERGDPTVDTSGLRDLIHELTYRLGLNDGDYIHPIGRNNAPKPTLEVRARSDNDPQLQLRAHILLQAVEDLTTDPNDAELKNWFFAGRYWNSFRVAAWESDHDGDGIESPLKCLREAHDFWFEAESDGVFSLEGLCGSLGLDLNRVRLTVAGALGGKRLRMKLALANAGARARKAGRHDPRPKPWHKVEADRYAPDRNRHNPWSIHFERSFEPPAIWAEIFRQPRPTPAEEKAAIARKRSAEWYERVGRALRRSRRAAA